jgi:hypothetical protein
MKAKPIIIVIVTLIIGFVLGMLTSAQMRYHRLKPVSVFFSEDRFRKGFYDLIKPDEKQKEVIDQILIKYGKVNSDIQIDFRKKMDTAFKDYWKELEPNLKKDQIARLREMEKRMAGMARGTNRNSANTNNFRDNGRMQGPGPEGRPQFNRDSNRMHDYHDSSRMRFYNDSARMRERMRGYRDSNNLKSNK